MAERSKMFMSLAYPNDSTQDAAPDKIERDYSSGERNVRMGKEAYSTYSYGRSNQEERK